MVLSDFRSGALFGYFSGIFKKIVFRKMSFWARFPKIHGRHKIFFACIVVLHSTPNLHYKPTHLRFDIFFKSRFCVTKNGFSLITPTVLVRLSPFCDFWIQLDETRRMVYRTFLLYKLWKLRKFAFWTLNSHKSGKKLKVHVIQVSRIQKSQNGLNQTKTEGVVSEKPFLVTQKRDLKNMSKRKCVGL